MLKLSTETCPRAPGPDGRSLLQNKGSRDSPIDLSTRSHSVTPSFQSYRSLSMSSSPLSSLGPLTVDTSLDGLDQLFAAAGTQNVEVSGDPGPLVERPSDTLADHGSKKRLVVQFKLHSVFLFRYPTKSSKAGHRRSGDWAPGDAHASETQIPWSDLIREVFANSVSGIMTHKEVWQAMEKRYSREMLSANQKSRNWRKSVHSTLHVGKDFQTIERLTSGWE